MIACANEPAPVAAAALPFCPAGTSARRTEDRRNRRGRRVEVENIKPKFSSWDKEVLCQVVDVDPKTVFGNFDNG